MNDPNGVLIDASTLTTAQREGWACIRCHAGHGPMRPVGTLNGVQVFACVTCPPSETNGAAR
ncbi:hypothetical protein [Microbispora bryophytorum]|uniref:hypothetical protein n=1 Tax=Microbispora bryophytorum TaxID=1460882 RepID=UPI0033F8CE82